MRLSSFTKISILSEAGTPPIGGKNPNSRTFRWRSDSTMCMRPSFSCGFHQMVNYSPSICPNAELSIFLLMYYLSEKKIFNRIAKQNNCTVSKASSFGREAYYENEFLQTCEYFSFYHDSRISGLPLSGCCNPSGRFSAVFLMYKNKQAAKAQKEKWDLEASKYKHIEHIDNDDGTGSTTIRSWWNQIVIQDENILIKIDNSDKNQTNLVSKVATEIKNYSNQYRDSRVGGTIYSGYPLVHEAGVRPTR